MVRAPEGAGHGGHGRVLGTARPGAVFHMAPLSLSSKVLQRVADPDRAMSTTVTIIWRRVLTGLGIGVIGAVAAAGLYAEATRVPDQP